jgi:hypothetical protein
MDQLKLTRDEWNSVETPLPADEVDILKFICSSFHDVHQKKSAMISIYDYLRIQPTKELDAHLAHLYFTLPNIPSLTKIKLKKADQIRLQQSKQLPETVYECVLIHLCKTKNAFHLDKLLRLYVPHVNPYVLEYCKQFILDCKIDVRSFVLNASQLLEHSPYVAYQDIQLYQHQKELFSAFSEPNKLVIYTAHTGMGKTLSPLGLSEKYNVIFVCTARHIGLAFANACCNMKKPFAMAFGCDTEDDIRLHYSAAKKFTVDKRSGTIRKVDNSVGDNVRIIISDAKSYLPSMRYMLRFQERETILTYMDEPTITMNEKENPLHVVLQENWKQNVIPNIVFSSATLPDIDYTQITDLPVHVIRSHESDRTVQIVSPDNTVVMPHHCATYEELQLCIQHMKKNEVLLKYVDLQGALHFLKDKKIPFTTLEEITIPNIKRLYVSTLSSMSKEEWTTTHVKQSVHPSINLCANDAWTCSYGPTIYMAKDVNKIAAYCLQSAKIPADIFTSLMKNLTYNAAVSDKISKLEKDMEDVNREDEKKEKKMADDRVSPEVKRIRAEIEQLHACIHSIEFPDYIIPNRKDHLIRYGHEDKLGVAFTSDIDRSIIERILSIDVDPSWKALLMLGIGVFSASVPPKYLEVMKDQATRQKLYLIIADPSFIYGTNYPFANAYIAKDLTHMTQEELIQSMGRVGRNKRVPYSIRLRDESFIKKIFMPQESPEGETMLRLYRK